MNKQEAIDYCYRHKDQWISDFGCITDGARAFECLIVILEEETIKPEELPSYGMDYKD